MTQESERSLQTISVEQLFPVRLSSDTKEQEVGPFGSIVAKVLKEMKALPDIRTEDDLPESIAYLLDTQGRFLVMIRRFRPPQLGNDTPDHAYGYFAEAYELDEDGMPQFSISDPYEISKGMYKRVDLSDKNAPRAANIQGKSNFSTFTPTDLTQTRLRAIASASGVPFLPAPVEDTKAGILDQLFIATEQHAVIAPNIEKEIRDKMKTSYMMSYIDQGMSDDTGRGHLIISEEGQNSELVELSRKVGLEPHVLLCSQATKFPGLYENPPSYEEYRSIDYIEKFKQRTGKYPLLVSFDARSITGIVQPYIRQAEDEFASQYARMRRKHPIFSTLRLPPPAKGSESVPMHRMMHGDYIYQGQDLQTMERLLIKIGTDYALTKQVRAVVALI